jgi:hypothetical protein
VIFLAELNKDEREGLIHGLMEDIIGDDPEKVTKDEIQTTIENILQTYHLSTNMDFVQKIATMKLGDGERVKLDDMPTELQDAAFLPVNTIADIALKQDLDLVISQIPEWFTAIQITRDAICEADAVDGTLARDIIFDKTRLSDEETETFMSKIEEVEDRLELHDMIKNHMVFNTLQYGEGSIYCVPYAKVFEDLYNYKMKSMTSKGKQKNSMTSAFSTTSNVLNGYGYGESYTEVSLQDTIVNEYANDNVKKDNNIPGLFTESEIMEMRPSYHAKNIEDPEKVKIQKESDKAFDAYLKMVANNIRIVHGNVSLPIIEESLHDLECVYDLKYGIVNNDSYNQRVENKFKMFFEQVQEADEYKPDEEEETFDKKFSQVKGVYLKVLPATKLIPIRIDRTIIGYYYISDGTRPEETGQRKNSGLTGYTLRTPSIGYDTFSPDRMFCEKLATKIINNFNLKFMRDNTSLHAQIVAVLETHRFNESLMRFIFIPADHVVTAAINKDGSGRGHAMLEPGLVTARMYMFLKLYSILYQINNSQIRVYNLRMSGMDKNYKKYVQEIMRKFAARRVSANDIFNYRASMSKVTGYSELVMPLGAGDQQPVQIENIPGAEAPINNELLDNMRAETLNATPVPSILTSNGGVTEIEFAKETELANTRFNSFIVGCKLDLNRPITVLYRKILRWETDIDPIILSKLKFKFRMPSRKLLEITNDKLNGIEAVMDLAVKIFLTAKEAKATDDGDTDVVREYKKQILGEYAPELDIERLEELANIARDKANEMKLEKVGSSENLVDDATDENA